MSTWWNSLAYRHVYEDLVKKMHPSLIRYKCFARVLITPEQRDDLSELTGAKHNRRLLSLVEKLNNDQYEIFCEVLLDNAVHVHDDSVAEMRKASVADDGNASAGCVGDNDDVTVPDSLDSRFSVADPWKRTEYMEVYCELLKVLNPSAVKIACYSLELIDDHQLEDINALTKHSDQNAEILKIVSRQEAHFGPFREILHDNMSTISIARDLDTIGPNRDLDEACLRARRILSREVGDYDDVTVSDSLDSRFSVADPWKRREYKAAYILLVRVMHPGKVTDFCFRMELIDIHQMEDIRALTKPSDKNAEILKIVSRQEAHFGPFREFLYHHVHMFNIARGLDTIGPDRDHEACLRVRRKLSEWNW